MGRRLGEPLPQRIKDALIYALNAGFEPPPTDAEIVSIVECFDKVMTLYSHVAWVDAGNAIIRFAGEDGTQFEIVAASELTQHNLARYGQERVGAGFVASVSEEDVARAREERRFPDVSLPIDEADLEDDEQDSS